MEKTTIQINTNTLERLKSIKSSERQSYDEILNNILDNLDEESLSEDEIRDIQRGLEDIRKGRVQTIEQVAKELRVTLK